MSLGTFSGRGFLLSDGIDLQYSKSGVAYARLPLVFSNSRKTDEGWVRDKELKVDATVFGPVAEFLTDQVTGRQEIHVSGELYHEEWTDKEGNTRTALKLQVGSASPIESRKPAASRVSSDIGF